VRSEATTPEELDALLEDALVLRDLRRSELSRRYA
jgi:hypothetical protein